MFSSLLQKGKSIKISKDGYTAATFRIIENEVYCFNEEIGDFPHERFTKNLADFDSHIENMLNEDFTITIF